MAGGESRTGNPAPSSHSGPLSQASPGSVSQGCVPSVSTQQPRLPRSCHGRSPWLAGNHWVPALRSPLGPEPPLCPACASTGSPALAVPQQPGTRSTKLAWDGSCVSSSHAGTRTLCAPAWLCLGDPRLRPASPSCPICVPVPAASTGNGPPRRAGSQGSSERGAGGRLNLSQWELQPRAADGPAAGGVNQPPTAGGSAG